MPFSISKDGYGADMAGGLQALIGNDYAKYKTTNSLGLADYIPEGGVGNVDIGGGQYNVNYDNATDKYRVTSLADPHLGSYVYGNNGKLENWTPYNSGSAWADFGMFLASALSMGAAGMAGAAAGTAADAGAVGSAGGFVGEGAMSGIPAWDAAGTSLGGTGAMGAGGAALGGEAGGAGMLGDATAAGYGGLDAGSAATMGGGAGVNGGAALGGAGALGAAGGGGGAAGGGASSGLGSLSNLGGTGVGVKDLIGPAAALGSGVIGANAASNAADAQLTAAREAAALQEPFRQGGIAGMNRLMDLLGLSSNTGAAGYGSAAKNFSMADYQADPGYQFRQQQGEQAIQRAASAAGRSDSGRAYKDLATFNSGLASQEYGNAYNRYNTNRAAILNPLQSLMGAGQTASGTIGDYTIQGGNAQAAGQIGSANAIGNAIGQGLGNYQQNQLLDLLKNRQSGSAYAN